MSTPEEIQDRINREIEKRLSEEMSGLKERISKEVKTEYAKQQKEDEEKAKIIAEENKAADVTEKNETEYFIRFNANFRFQHIVLLTSTVMLIVTGIPLKFPKNGVSLMVINWFGGVAGARSMHHLFALGLIFIGLYHLFYSFWARDGRKDFFELLPSLKDFSDLINQLKYYFGIRKEKVRYGRFSYIEKFDYWAVYWGLIMMIGTGAIMWLFQGKFEPWPFGEINLSFGPSIVTNTVHAIAREMHSDEALLATLVIIGWHFYNVHLNPHKFPMSRVWLNGRMTKEEMLNEHALEYEEIMKKRKEESDKEKEVMKEK